MTDPQDYFICWEEFHRDTRALAKLLLQQHTGTLPWRGIVGIARGGLIPAALLARELNIRYVDSICIASYEHNRQDEIRVIKGIEGDGEGFLLVDDLVDTGITAKVARELLPKAEFVTLYAKPAGRKFTRCFVREFPQTTWLHFPWDTDIQFREPMAQQFR